ncbi:SigB/SigF/SigG family RNA polymerase sigma factor [Mumia zhuanghuii]|uniref:SigB/SigF/SigG family RNA polymerase sigma factor n=2 Tax=Mumia TaxID=1546255 RepID=A0ABW1QJT5_9ACTN|nr:MULTISPECIES: SigB/SigF/SigG family RNA polymerase sigma factor [Mumia]KAA1419745.1 SigB/SigF/SigG family RNA polymerase sigma factor [Mumia zhuanghuii]
MPQTDDGPTGPRDETDALFDALSALPSTSDDERAALRTRLIELNVSLVRQVARRYASWNFPLDDAVQIGSVGLIKAVDSFDPTLGHAFSSYAVPKIVGEIRHFLRDSNWIVRVPRRAQELQGAVAKARDDLTHELGRSPAISEIAERLGASPEDVVGAVESFRLRSANSLDSVNPDGAPDLAIEAAISVEERGFAHTENSLDLKAALERLTDDERHLLVRRFDEEMSQSQIAAELGVSQVQVSRLLRRTLERLRGHMGE